MSAIATAERCASRNMSAQPTLDELVARAWHGLGGHHAVDCPLCGELMAPVYGAHALPVGGRCAGCGTELR